MVDWVVITKNTQAVYFAKNRGNYIIKHKNGFYVIIPITNSEAHKICEKYNTVKIKITEELYCTVCKNYHCNKVYIHSDPTDIPPCLTF